MTRDWADSDYSRIYHSVLTDPKFEGIYDDTRAFGWYVKLLITADSTYPAPAPIPRSIPQDDLDKLVTAGLIVLHKTDLYTISGLTEEREHRDSRYAAGGKARAASAARGPGGQFAPATLVDAGDVAGPAFSQRHPARRDETRTDETRTIRAHARGVNVGLLRARHNGGLHAASPDRDCPSCDSRAFVA